MLTVAGAAALVVYYKFGVAILRQAWINLDRIWAAVLILAGVAAIAL
jgi:hypothetical protein